MPDPAAATIATARALLSSYNQAAKDDDERGVDEKLLSFQAERSALIVERIDAGGALVLPDPVGSGKTAVALIAAAMLVESKQVRRVVVIAPNQPVAKMWQTRAKWVASPNAKKMLHSSTTFVTRRELFTRQPSIRKPVKPEGVLVIVDEAHRGLQTEGAFQEQLERWTEGCQVLLLTATPFLLSSQGLVTMLQLGNADNDARAPVVAYGEAVRALATRYREAIKRAATDPAKDPKVVQALEKAVARQPGAIQALTRRILPEDAQLARLRPETPILRKDRVAVNERWEQAYHVARVVPELIDKGMGDMFNRRLISCSEAFWGGTAGVALERSTGVKTKGFIKVLEAELGGGLSHPKVAATARWVADRVNDKRHVLVFCVFNETQATLENAIKTLVGNRDQPTVVAPSGAVINKEYWTRFTQPPGDHPLVLVVQDRFSESIDLDGGQPCLVHHDLPWTPARITQRWGRVVRAGSGFAPVAANDIYVPILTLDADERLFDTVKTRARIGQLLLPRGIADQMDEEPDEFALPVELLERLGQPAHRSGLGRRSVGSSAARHGRAPKVSP